jgi:hypothetical protein
MKFTSLRTWRCSSLLVILNRHLNTFTSRGRGSFRIRRFSTGEGGFGGPGLLGFRFSFRLAGGLVGFCTHVLWKMLLRRIACCRKIV